MRESMGIAFANCNRKETNKTKNYKKIEQSRLQNNELFILWWFWLKLEVYKFCVCEVESNRIESLFDTNMNQIWIKFSQIYITY